MKSVALCARDICTGTRVGATAFPRTRSSRRRAFESRFRFCILLFSVPQCIISYYAVPRVYMHTVIMSSTKENREILVGLKNKIKAFRPCAHMHIHTHTHTFTYNTVVYPLYTCARYDGMVYMFNVTSLCFIDKFTAFAYVGIFFSSVLTFMRFCLFPPPRTLITRHNSGSNSLAVLCYENVLRIGLITRSVI